jgi:hypothetical protein
MKWSLTKGRSRTRFKSILVLLTCRALTLPGAWAQSVPEPEVTASSTLRWILLEADSSFSRSALEIIREDLAVGLRLNRTEVFLEVPASGEAPLAVVRLRSKGNALVALEVEDHLTNKRLERDVDLHALPLDGHTLALAQAVDELLRASWAEISLDPSRNSELAAPIPKKIVTQEKVPHQASGTLPGTPRFVFALRPALEWWTGGQGFWGADALSRYQRERWFIEVRAGLRKGFDVPSARGLVRSQALLFSAWFGIDLLRDKRWLLGPELGLQVGQVRFWGLAAQGSEGSEIAGLLSSARAGLVGGFRSGAFTLSVDAGVGVPLAGVRATSEGEDVTGAVGLELWTGLSAGAAF